MVITPQYDYLAVEVGDFEFDNTLFVYHNDKWGLIDTKGNYIVEPMFDCIVSDIDGIGAVFAIKLWRGEL